MNTLPKEEQDKATLDSHFALIARYARAGNSITVMTWLEHRMTKALADVKSRRQLLVKQFQDNDRQAR